MKKDRILVVAAHPDDEVLGCGGAIARHVAAGDVVHCLFLADGASSRGAAEDIGERQRQALAAAQVLGMQQPEFAGFADNQLDALPLLTVVRRVEETVRVIGPHVIYTHPANDLNVDHRIAHQAVITACRPQPGSSVRAIHAFEVPSSTEWASVEGARGFRPTRFVDISRFMEQKMAALACYAEEMRPFPHARSMEAVRALATWRGTSVGVRAAEAFVVIREIFG